MAKNRGHQKPRFQRSDIPYSDRLLIQRHESVAKHRNEAAATALKLACVALNESEGLGYQRLARFAKTLHGLIDEYYSDIEVGEAHLNKRLKQLGFIVVEGRVFVAQESSPMIPEKVGQEGSSHE